MKRLKKHHLEKHIGNCEPEDVTEDSLLKGWRAGQVCRIRLRGEKLHGTGFLIGPRAILTNWHVFYEMRHNTAAVEIAFDFKHEEDLHSIRSEVLRLSSEPLHASSPVEEEDEEARVDELDYAVLLLERKIGLENGRGWNVLPSEPPAKWRGEAVTILQHPQGKILRGDGHIATRLNSCKSRVYYLASTDDGSSGGPCFNKKWEAVALHQGHSSKSNRGIPTHLIRKDLIEKKKWEALCAEDNLPELRRDSGQIEGGKNQGCLGKSIFEEAFSKGLKEHFLSMRKFLILALVTLLGGLLLMKFFHDTPPVVVVHERDKVEVLPEIGWKYLDSSIQSSRKIYGDDPFTIAKQQAKRGTGKPGNNSLGNKQSLSMSIQRDIGLTEFMRKDFESAVVKAREVSRICETQNHHVNSHIQRFKDELKRIQSGEAVVLGSDLERIKTTLQGLEATRKGNREIWLYSLVLEGSCNVAMRRWKDAIVALDKVKNVLDKELEHERWCIATLALANALMEYGEYKNAMPLYEEVVRIRKKNLGKADHQTLLAQHSLGRNLYHLGKYAESREVVERVVQEFSSKYGRVSPMALRLKNPIGAAYIGEQDYVKAIDFLEKLSGDLEGSVGGGDSELFICRSNLAEAYMIDGNLRKAQGIAPKNYRQSKEKLGSQHPASMSAGITLGSLYLLKEDYSNAEKVFNSVIKDKKNYYGSKHPETQWSRAHLAIVYFRLKKFDDARLVIEKSSRALKSQLGERHPKVLIMQEILGGIYLAQGQYRKTVTIIEKFLPLQIEILGEDSLYALNSMMNLSLAYSALKEKWDESTRLVESAVSMCNSKYGFKHETSLSYMLTQSLFYARKGEVDKAIKINEKVVRISAEEYGSENSLVFEAKSAFALMYLELKKFQEAKALMEQIYSLSKEKNGAIHLRTLEYALNLSACYLELGELGRAQGVIVEILRLYDNLSIKKDYLYYVFVINKAELHAKLGEYKRAIELYKLSRKGLSNRYASTHPYMQEIELGMQGVEKEILKQKKEHE